MTPTAHDRGGSVVKTRRKAGFFVADRVERFGDQDRVK
jgi:hypothetical protein